MSTYILIGVIAVVGLVFFISCNGKKTEKTKIETKSEKNPFLDLRKIAFSVTSEQLELGNIGENDVYGIVSEMDMEGATVTVVALSNGDTSLYLSSGGGFIGAGQHESVQKVVKKFVQNGQQYLKKTIKIEKPELPKNGKTNFNFLTKNGIYSVTETTGELESGKSEFSKLFIELNEVIEQIRLKSES